MTKVLAFINLVLMAVLVYILIYPQLKAKQIVEASVAYMANEGALPLFVAEEKGYFDSVKVKIRSEEVLNTAEGIENVGKGKNQFFVGGDWAETLHKIAVRPEAYRVAYSTYYSSGKPYAAIVTLRKNRKIKSIKDLVLHRLGYPKGTQYKLILSHYLKVSGIDPEKISFVGLLPSEMDSALEKNLADVLFAPEPYRSLLIYRKDLKVIEDGYLVNHIGSPLPAELGITSIVNTNLNHEKTKRVWEALSKAIDYIRQNPDSAELILRERLGIKDTVKLSLPSIRTYSEIEPAVIKRFIDSIKECEVIFVDIDPQKILLSPAEIK